MKALAITLSFLGCFCLVQGAEQQAKRKPDPLLGEWVCLANNVDKRPVSRLVFKSDGTALLSENKGKPVVLHYRREPAEKWWARRKEEFKRDPKLRELATQKSMWFDRPGAEMVYFGSKKDGFQDWGGGLLTLYPSERILLNPITQLWCRPGEEARALALTKR